MSSASPSFHLTRGASFFNNLEKLCDSPKAMNLIAKWREATASLQIDQISYRRLSHWEEMGLLQCQREGSTGWRRFNLFEGLWLHALVELRRFGLPLDKIKAILPSFFRNISVECPVRMVEYYVLGAVVFQQPTWLIILPDSAEFLSHVEYINALEMKELEHHFCISISHLLAKLFKNFEIRMPFTVPLDSNSFEIFNTMANGEFDKLTVHKKKQTLTGYEFEKTFPNTESPKTLIEDFPDTEITIKRREGKVTSLKRKISKKFTTKAQG